MASDTVLQRLHRTGQGSLQPAAGLAALGAMLTHQGQAAVTSGSVAQLAVNPFAWRVFLDHLGAVPPMFASFSENVVTGACRTPVPEVAGTCMWTLALALQFKLTGSVCVGAGSSQASPKVAQTLTHAQVCALVSSLLANILGSPIGDNDPLMSVGLDSLGSVELVNMLSRRVGLQLPSSLVFDYPTVTAIVQHIESRIRGAGGDAEHSMLADQPVQLQHADLRSPAAVSPAIIAAGCCELACPARADGSVRLWSSDSAAQAWAQDAVRCDLSLIKTLSASHQACCMLVHGLEGPWAGSVPPMAMSSMPACNADADASR